MRMSNKFTHSGFSGTHSSWWSEIWCVMCACRSFSSFSTIQPVMFLLLFTYVFGGAIKTGASGSYINYLLAGHFGANSGLRCNPNRGRAHRRFGERSDRPLPSLSDGAQRGSRGAHRGRHDAQHLCGGTHVRRRIFYRISDLQGSYSDAIAAFAILLLFGFAFSWISATIGMLVKNVETAQVAGFIWVFPLVFASSIFVPVESMPDWLQSFAKHTPITLTVDAVRALTLATRPAPPTPYTSRGHRARGSQGSSSSLCLSPSGCTEERHSAPICYHAHHMSEADIRAERLKKLEILRAAGWIRIRLGLNARAKSRNSLMIFIHMRKRKRRLRSLGESWRCEARAESYLLIF
jgi:hypothetical protein